jgi:hypothetical protein
MRRLKNSKRQPISATNLCNTSDDSKTASEIIHLSELNSTVTFHRVQLHLHVGNDLLHADTWRWIVQIVTVFV